MTYFPGKDRGGLSPHMSVRNSSGKKLYKIKGRWLDVVRTHYEFINVQKEHSYKMVQNHTIGNVVFSILENGECIGSCGTNHTCSTGLIDIRGIGRAKMNLGHGLDTHFTLKSSEEEFARISRDGQEWQIEIATKYSHPVIIAGLAVIYGEYLKRD